MKINFNRLSLWFFFGVEILGLLILISEVGGFGLRQVIAPPTPAVTVYVEAEAYPLLKEQRNFFKEQHPNAKYIKIKRLEDADVNQLLTQPKVAVLHSEGPEMSTTDVAQEELLLHISGTNLYWISNVTNSATVTQFKNFIKSETGRKIAQKVPLKKKNTDS